MLRIVPFPHPALRYVSRPVTQIDDAFRATVRSMFDLMYAARGIGLAANQVALPFRFFVLNLSADPEKKEQEQVFINPVIVKRHSAIEDEEGCLSLPGVYEDVRRSKKIKVQSYDLQGNLIEVEAHDLLSRAIQHELDHLDGRLFIDYLDPVTRHKLAPRLQTFEADYRRVQKVGEFAADDDILRDLETMTQVPFPDVKPAANEAAPSVS